MGMVRVFAAVAIIVILIGVLVLSSRGLCRGRHPDAGLLCPDTKCRHRNPSHAAFCAKCGRKL